MFFNFKVCLTTYFCSLEEIKVVSHEFSQNQKIVTDGFPTISGHGTERLLQMHAHIISSIFAKKVLSKIWIFLV